MLAFSENALLIATGGIFTQFDVGLWVISHISSVVVLFSQPFHKAGRKFSVVIQ